MNKTFNIPSFGEVNINLNLNKIDRDSALKLLRTLLKIRFFELKCADAKREGFIGGPVHLAIGQEAIAVGISEFLGNQDYIFSGHRSHAHVLALQSSPESIFAEILGKETGVSGGFGGSMHLFDPDHGFYGSVPIVSGTVSLGLGSAFASKYQNLDSITVVYFGDGAIEEGIVHEALNMASNYELPILFICENNYMASHMHLTQRQKSQNLTRFALANNIDFVRLDGNNVIEVVQNAKQIIHNMRKSQRPFFIEALTYRQLGHVDWREDVDVGVERSIEEISKWKEFDPIKRLKASLLLEGWMSENDFENMRKEQSDLIELAWLKAIKEPLPDKNRLLSTVYSTKDSDED